MMAQGQLRMILGLLLSSVSEAPGDDRGPWRVPPPGPTPTGLLARVDPLIERSLSAPPSRAALCAALGMSESSFSHRFRAETGMSLSERIRWLRVRRAQSLLVDPEASVKNVARQLGFTSAFYFSSVFSAVTGLSPSRYRAEVLRRLG
jgi:AraC-like DNA-binding protein